MRVNKGGSLCTAAQAALLVAASPSGSVRLWGARDLREQALSQVGAALALMLALMALLAVLMLGWPAAAWVAAVGAARRMRPQRRAEPAAARGARSGAATPPRPSLPARPPLPSPPPCAAAAHPAAQPLDQRLARRLHLALPRHLWHAATLHTLRAGHARLPAALQRQQLAG